METNTSNLNRKKEKKVEFNLLVENNSRNLVASPDGTFSAYGLEAMHSLN